MSSEQRLADGQRQPVHIRNIAKDIILTLLTCGLFNIYVQHRQIQALNAMLRNQKYSTLHWFLLTLITCGIYHIYHEYRISSDLVILQKLDPNEPLLIVILAIFGMSIVADAIQQSHINHYYGHTGL